MEGRRIRNDRREWPHHQSHPSGRDAGYWGVSFTIRDWQLARRLRVLSGSDCACAFEGRRKIPPAAVAQPVWLLHLSWKLAITESQKSKRRPEAAPRRRQELPG